MEDKDFEYYEQYDADCNPIHLIWNCRITDRERLKHPFVGMCGWKFKDTDDLTKKVHPHQHFIIHAVANDMVIIRLFSWLDGTPTHMEAYPLEDIKKWHLFTNNKDMNESYYHDFPTGSMTGLDKNKKKQTKKTNYTLAEISKMFEKKIDAKL
tara:strand:+ start:7283 stop:7741 length:459 start_codon:yes stop_codon:yes gene_type:complete